MGLQRWRRLLPGLWLGWLLCVGLLATPAPFATLGAANAGPVVARMLAQEAYTALVLGVLVLLLERAAARSAGGDDSGSGMSPGVLLALGTLFCSVAGYFALQPLMPAARAGQSALSFAQLHSLSVGFFIVKTGLVAALAWRAATATPSS